MAAFASLPMVVMAFPLKVWPTVSGPSVEEKLNVAALATRCVFTTGRAG